MSNNEIPDDKKTYLRYVLVIVGVCWIGALELAAMFNNIDGQYFATALSAIVALISGALGFAIGKKV